MIHGQNDKFPALNHYFRVFVYPFQCFFLAVEFVVLLALNGFVSPHRAVVVNVGFKREFENAVFGKQSGFHCW